MVISFLAPVDETVDTLYKEVKIDTNIVPRMGEDVLLWENEQSREVCQILHNYVKKEIVILLSNQHKD